MESSPLVSDNCPTFLPTDDMLSLPWLTGQKRLSDLVACVRAPACLPACLQDQYQPGTLAPSPPPGCSCFPPAVGHQHQPGALAPSPLPCCSGHLPGCRYASINYSLVSCPLPTALLQWLPAWSRYCWPRSRSFLVTQPLLLDTSAHAATPDTSGHAALYTLSPHWPCYRWSRSRYRWSIRRYRPTHRRCWLRFCWTRSC